MADPLTPEQITGYRYHRDDWNDDEKLALLDTVEQLRQERDSLLRSFDEALDKVAALKKTVSQLRQERDALLDSEKDWQRRGDLSVRYREALESAEEQLRRGDGALRPLMIRDGIRAALEGDDQ